MVDGWAPSGAGVGSKVLLSAPAAPSREGAPRGRSPRPSARSRLHGRGQRGISARRSPGRAAGPLPGARDSRAAPPPAATVQLQLLLLPSPPPPPGPRAQLLLLGDGSCGDEGLRAQTPGPRLHTGPSRPGRSPPLLCASGPDRCLRFWGRALRSRSSSSSGRRTLPGPCSRALASPAFPPAGPTSCASLAGRTGAGRSAGPARSGYKVSAPGGALGIKEGAGPDTPRNSGEGEGDGPPERPAPVTFPL